MRLSALLFALLSTTNSGCRPTAGDDPHAVASPPAAGPAASVSGATWWVTATFAPTSSVIAGIPVAEIDPSWTAALLLDRSILPPEAANDLSGIADSTIRFEWTGDFDHDGMRDRAVVGVYRTNSDSTGRFLLVLTETEGRVLATKVGQLPGPPSFSGLSLRGDTLIWAECMECDSYWAFAWDGKSYAVLPDPSEEE